MDIDRNDDRARLTGARGADLISRKLSDRIIRLNYETVACCDLRSGTLYIRDAKDPLDAALNGLPYEQALEKAAAQTDSPAGAEAFISRLTLSAVRERLEETDVYTFYYASRERADRFPGTPQRQMKTDVFYLDGERDILVFLFTDVTEILERERENRE